MKGIIIVDIPVDDPVEIDEYGMVADLKIWPMTLTKREDLFFELEHVDIRPIPSKMKVDYDTIASCEVTEKVVAMGWNACISAILGEIK